MNEETNRRSKAHLIDVKAMLHLTYIYGPVSSRRLGTSLGVNPLPVETKICNFDCPYCECGWTNSERPTGKMPSLEILKNELEATLEECRQNEVTLDAITFAGNGEPTLHPQFDEIIEAACALRDRLAPSAKVCVLTNATRLRLERVRRGLLRADIRQMKVDAGTERTFQLVDRPAGGLTLESIITDICEFDAPKMIQSMFFRGTVNGERIDNTVAEELDAWLSTIARIKPTAVHLYSLDRKTAASDLEKVSSEEMEAMAVRVRALGVPAEAF